MGGFIGRFIGRVGIDKICHFAVSAFLTLALGRFVHWAIAAVVVALLGIAKELLDGTVDWRDLVADAVGIIIATILILI